MEFICIFELEREGKGREGKGRKSKIVMYCELVYKIIVLRKGKFDRLGVFPCLRVK